MLRICFVILFLSFFSVGCSSTKYVKLKLNKNIEKTPKVSLNNQKDSIQTLKIKKISYTKQTQTINMNKAFMDFYQEWRGVKYKLGGNSKKGIDCSAFTQRAFKEKFNINIPRTTRTQVKVGKKIKKSQLEMGDLVFFKTGKVDRHVGIYMGNGKFLHASIKGVKFTKLNKPYYKKAYWTSRRVIN